MNNNTNKITSYSLIAMLLLMLIAYIYTVNIICTGKVNESNSKVVAAFNA